MAVIRIKNLNTALHRRLRFIGADGSSIDIQGQDGAVVLFGTKDLRVCLAPLTTSDCDGAINVSSLLSITGMFDFYLYDLTTPLYTNISPEELITLLQNNDDIEIIES